MKDERKAFLNNILNNPSSTFAFVAAILFIMGFFLSIVTPEGVSKWYHVFFKLMMFMSFVMSFIFSVIALIKGLQMILKQDRIHDIRYTMAGIIATLLIILIMIISLYSNPYIIDIFGLTKKLPPPTPNIIQTW